MEQKENIKRPPSSRVPTKMAHREAVAVLVWSPPCHVSLIDDAGSSPGRALPHRERSKQA
jgi:hypothetical protein